MKFFENIDVTSKKHFYCSECISPLVKDDGVCRECHTEKLEKSYFIECDIISQLQDLFFEQEFTDDLNYVYEERIKENPNGIEDIFDGALYREYAATRNPPSDKYILSFMWYADGAAVLKSRKYSVWPLYLIINELPYSKRFKKKM